MLGKRKKAVLVVVLVLVFLISTYMVADQICFQYQKSEYIADAKQYAADLVAADNISESDFSKGTDWILSNQRRKRGALFQKYSGRKESEETSAYLNALERKLNKGWKWHDETIGDIRTVSAWKSPFSPYAHIVLMYSTAVQCDSGGMVVYEGNIASLKREKDSTGVMQTYSKNDFLVSCYGKSAVEIAHSGAQDKSQTDLTMRFQENAG